MIGNGRKVLTASSDGTTRLWDVGQGTQERLLPSCKFSSVNVVSVGRNGNEASGESEATSSSSSLLITGLSNGIVEGHDLFTGSSIFTLPSTLFPSGEGPKAVDQWEQVTSGSVEAMDWCRDTNLLIAGCNNGVTLAHDMRMLSSSNGENSENSNRSLVASWRRNGAGINKIHLLPTSNEALLATTDGTPYRVNLQGQQPRVVEEYNGWDVDNVQGSALDAKGRVWLAGANGYLRMY
jgi:WD40 repeat protein